MLGRRRCRRYGGGGNGSGNGYDGWQDDHRAGVKRMGEGYKVVFLRKSSRDFGLFESRLLSNTLSLDFDKIRLGFGMVLEGEIGWQLVWSHLCGTHLFLPRHFQWRIQNLGIGEMRGNGGNSRHPTPERNFYLYTHCGDEKRTFDSEEAFLYRT
jgi:hypothetical protein